MTKISDLTALTGASVDAANDLVPVVDASETGIARSKKMTFAELKTAMVASGAIVDYVTAQIAAAVAGLLDLKGGQDCSGNPNYPAASKGDAYVVTVAGKIGGASGTTVAVGDVYFATADNAGGTQAAVGASWDTILHSASLAGALLAANNLSDVANAATALANLGGASKALTIEAVTGTSYTFAAADSGKHKRFTNGSAITATVPLNATVAIPTGTRIRITAAGAGQITLTPESGSVTLNSRGAALKSAGQFAVLEIEKVATDEWDLLGDVSA